jgi:hypothetical protein
MVSCQRNCSWCNGPQFSLSPKAARRVCIGCRWLQAKIAVAKYIFDRTPMDITGWPSWLVSIVWRLEAIAGMDLGRPM